MKKCLLLCLLFLSSFVYGQVEYKYRFQNPAGGAIGTANSGFFNTGATGTTFAALSWTISGSPATCTVQVDFSNDGTTVAGQLITSQVCTSNGSIISGVSSTPPFVRVSWAVAAGGSLTFIDRGCTNSTCTVGGGGGAGTVTNTGGALTLNSPVLGAGGNDTKVVAGIVSDGVSKLTLGSTGVGGGITFFGATSGSTALTFPGNSTQMTWGGSTILISGTGSFQGASNATLSGNNGSTFIKSNQSTIADTIDNISTAVSTLGATTGTGQIGFQEATTFNPTSGSVRFTDLIAQPTINQTGGANGTIRVLGAYPVNTALVGLEYLLALGTSTTNITTGVYTDKLLVDTNGLMQSGNACNVTADITLTVNTPITICTWSLPAQAHGWGFRCNMIWVISAGTGTNTISIGVNPSQTPTGTTNIAATIDTTTATITGSMAAVPLSASGALNVLTSGTITPAATLEQAQASGTLLASGTAGTFAITMTAAGTTATAAAKAGSTCALY